MGLRRWDGADDTLRAWDAADQYLLRTLEEEGMNLTPKNIVVLNDGFGAISIPLIAQNSVITLTDSATAAYAIRQNDSQRHHAHKTVRVHTTFELPTDFTADLCLFKVPKSLDKLTHQLKRIRPLLNQQTQIIGAGMTKKFTPAP